MEEMTENKGEKWHEKESKRKGNICPKCKEKERYDWYPYCFECYLAYNRERRKRPEVRKRDTEYKRRYRALKKDPFGLVVSGYTG